jgi:hypothetical protein
VVENRVGATGTIGTEAVVRAPPDGYTLLFTADLPITMAPALLKLRYDPQRDLAPVAALAKNDLLLVVHPPEATRRAFNKRFLLDLAEDWQQHGREVFKRVRRESPASYLKVCAMLVPREMKLEHSGGVKAMTDEQLERSLEVLKELIAQRDAGASAKVIEGEAEVVPSLPAPGSGGTKTPKA